MRGPGSDGSQLAEFVSARTAELHRTAYLLTADQERAEGLVQVAVDRLRRDRSPLGQAGAAARTYMARLAAAVDDEPTMPADDDRSPADSKHLSIAGMSPRQRAVLMLRTLDRYDVRSTARELGISASAVTAAETEAGRILGIPTDSDQCRTALVDFADRATWPDPAVTLAAAAQVAPPRRRSPWRYVAVAVVLMIGAAAPVASQVQHDRWLRSPDGINAAHGTHFHAYTQGFKLVGVQRVPAGSTRSVTLSAGDAIALGCAHFSLKTQAGWPRTDLGTPDGVETFPCARESAQRYYLQTNTGKTTVTAPRAGHQPISIAHYKSVPWENYPIAHDHFDVEHDKDLGLDARLNFDAPPVRAGKTRTLHGTNGTVAGSITLPPAAKGTQLFMSALLSPSTSGQYKVTIDGQVFSNCSPVDTTGDGWCRLYDHYVPQLPFALLMAVGESQPEWSDHTTTVKVQVRDALGPWKLQVRYDRYRARE